MTVRIKVFSSFSILSKEDNEQFSCSNPLLDLGESSLMPFFSYLGESPHGIRLREFLGGFFGAFWGETHSDLTK